MRMMMKVAIPTDAGNKSVADGSLPRVMGQFIERWKPEGSYFTTAGDGQRCAYFFVDLPDVADIPSMAEPFFMQLHANVIFQPAMNAADMAAGVGKAMQQHG
jgi:hypothetical protein